MERDEIKEWLRNPATEWFLREVREAHPLDWLAAPSWEHLNRLKGQWDVLRTMARLTE